MCPRASPGISLALNYEVGFTVIPHGASPGWHNLIHFNADGTDYGHPGSRVPGVWFYPNSTRMHTVDGGDTNANYNDYCDRPQQLPIGVPTAVRILMLSNQVWIYMNGTLACTEVRHGRQLWTNVTVYVSDPWYPAALATVGVSPHAFCKSCVASAILACMRAKISQRRESSHNNNCPWECSWLLAFLCIACIILAVSASISNCSFLFLID